jgi:hypothetical protein
MMMRESARLVNTIACLLMSLRPCSKPVNQNVWMNG